MTAPATRTIPTASTLPAAPTPLATNPSLDPPEPAHRSRAVLGIACGTTFLAYLDVAVVNLGFTSIHADFPVAQATLTWVVSGYAIAFAAALAAAGRLSDLLGHRRVLLAGILGFALTSVACALAPSVGWLVAGRAAQGVAGAMVLPAALGALLAAFSGDAKRSAAAIGAWSATGALAAAIGPSAGAVLVDEWGWRSLFWINLPVCAVLFAAAIAVLPRRGGRGGANPDWWGVLLLSAGIAAVVAAFTEGHQWGPTSALTVSLLAAGVAALAAVLWRSYRHAHPALEVRLWSRPGFALANIVSAALGFGLFAYLLAAPMFLTLVWKLSLLDAAGCVGGAATAAMISAALVGRWVSAPRAGWFGAAGMSLLAGAFAVMASPIFGTDRDWSLWTLTALALGAGLGCAITALSVAASTAAENGGYAGAIGLNLTARQIGGALGVAALAATLTETRFLSTFHTLFLILAVVSGVAALISLLMRTQPGLTETEAQ